MLIVKYEYKCGDCDHLYVEQRTNVEPQYFTICNLCGTGEYFKVKETNLEEIPDVVAE